MRRYRDLFRRRDLVSQNVDLDLVRVSKSVDGVGGRGGNSFRKLLILLGAGCRNVSNRFGSISFHRAASIFEKVSKSVELGFAVLLAGATTALRFWHRRNPVRGNKKD